MSATDPSTNSSVKNAPERSVRLTRENSGTSSPGPGLAPTLRQGGHRHGLGRSGLDDAVEFAKIEQTRGILLQRERYDRACLDPGAARGDHRHVQPTGGARLGSALPGRR